MFYLQVCRKIKHCQGENKAMNVEIREKSYFYQDCVTFT